LKILVTLTYYHPHISGLTVLARRVAEGLAGRGHQVTVLTSRYHPGLARVEEVSGVRVERVPVRFRIGKGVFMPRYPEAARRLLDEHDLVLANVPTTPWEARWVARAASRLDRPLVCLYHCDLQLPPGPCRWLFQALADWGGARLLSAARAVIVATRDYAEHSPALRNFREKLRVIPPPIFRLGQPSAQPEWAKGPSPRIGFAARLAAEKGVEYLLQAIPEILRALPDARFVFVGEKDGVVGERRYHARLAPLLDQVRTHCRFLGVIPDGEMGAFYRSCDALVLPSVNPTESFGMVQVESMLCGTPVVATELPGVRVPVRSTGMGRLVPPRDPGALARAAIEILAGRERYLRSPEEVEAALGLTGVVERYEALLKACLADARSPEAVLRWHLAELPAFRALVRSVECLLMQSAGPLARPLLDLGCGDGWFARFALPNPVDVGIDPDLAALREAAGRRAHTRLLQADGRDLPLPTASMATVVCNSTIEHIPDPDRVVREIARVLIPGGRLLLTVPSQHFAEMLLGSTLPATWRARNLARRYGAWFNRHSKHVHTDSPEVWQSRLAACGLQVARWHYYLSPESHRAFDLCHYLCLPHFLSYRLTGKWVTPPLALCNGIFFSWLRRYLVQVETETGPYFFMDGRKADV